MCSKDGIRPQCQSSVPISMKSMAQLLLFSHISVNACEAVVIGWVNTPSWGQLAFAFGFDLKSENIFVYIRLVEDSQ